MSSPNSSSGLITTLLSAALSTGFVKHNTHGHGSRNLRRRVVGSSALQFPTVGRAEWQIVIAECGNNPRTEANVIGNLVEAPIAPCQALKIP